MHGDSRCAWAEPSINQTAGEIILEDVYSSLLKKTISMLYWYWMCCN